MTLDEAAARVLALFRELANDGIQIYTDDQEQISLIRRERTDGIPIRLFDRGDGVMTSGMAESVHLAGPGNVWEKED